MNYIGCRPCSHHAMYLRESQKAYKERCVMQRECVLMTCQHQAVLNYHTQVLVLLHGERRECACRPIARSTTWRPISSKFEEIMVACHRCLGEVSVPSRILHQTRTLTRWRVVFKSVWNLITWLCVVFMNFIFIFIFKSLPSFHTFRCDTGHHGPSLEHAIGEGTEDSREWGQCPCAFTRPSKLPPISSHWSVTTVMNWRQWGDRWLKETKRRWAIVPSPKL